ncbi:hypothetical protein BKA65DRAFT_503753 [Rhexocercosporidium sp. MPI-PUGE-AT-0058]|nr:hypothetical protein BKA65DRAFT_503753 [Rhexocercosporidium sp. MPI-PUGE-AT-0058]
MNGPDPLILGLSYSIFILNCTSLQTMNTLKVTGCIFISFHRSFHVPANFYFLWGLLGLPFTLLCLLRPRLPIT